MTWLAGVWGSALLCAAVWVVSFMLLPRIEQVNLVQRLNFGTINAVFALVFLHLVLSPGG
ncbi:MAG: hypothetical protein ABJK20_11540 [Halieaceae bacterium]